MTATFLITLSIDDTNLALVAQDLRDDLVASGHEVTDVKPWARPTTAPQQILPQPPIQ